MNTLSKEKVNELIKIIPNNIIEGFNKYNNAIITHNEENKNNKEIENCFINFISDIYNRGQTIVVDYYGNKLNDKEFENMTETLEIKEKELLYKLRKKNINSVYFIVENLEYLKLVMKLSVKSILFSTFYILGNDLTIWSNYDYKFVIFFNNYDVLEFYKDVLEKSNLIIKDIKITNK